LEGGGCDEKMQFLEDANGEELFDYAQAKMDSGVESGTYSKNLIFENGDKYLRTVTWTIESSGKRVSNLTITFISE